MMVAILLSLLMTSSKCGMKLEENHPQIQLIQIHNFVYLWIMQNSQNVIFLYDRKLISRRLNQHSRSESHEYMYDQNNSKGLFRLCQFG